MAHVEIEYCVPCGFRDRAIEVESAILNGLEERLDRLSFVMGEAGVFVVRVDGETVFDKSEDEYDVDEIVRQVRSAI